MKKFLSALSLATILGMTGTANASSLSCKMTGHVKGGGLQFGLGYFKMTGPGTMSCKDEHGVYSSRDTFITIGGSPLAGRIAVGYFNMGIATGSFGFNGSIDDLYGHYLSTGAHAAALFGTGTHVQVENPMNGARLNVGVEGSLGIGFDLGLSLMTIEAPAAVEDHCEQQQQQQQQHHHHRHHDADDADLSETEL